MKTDAAPVPAPEPFSDLDNWRFDEKLRRAEQVVKGRVPGGPAVKSAPVWSGGDVPHQGPPDWHFPQAVARRARWAQRSVWARLTSCVAWGLLALGLAAFVCGAVLSGWSLFSGRAELWNVGMPITLAGQLMLLLGLILQLDRLGQDNRRQADSLKRVGQQLDHLSGEGRLDGPQPTAPSTRSSGVGLTSPLGSKTIPPPSAEPGRTD